MFLDLGDITIKLADDPDQHLEYDYENNLMIVTNAPINAKSRFIITPIGGKKTH